MERQDDQGELDLIVARQPHSLGTILFGGCAARQRNPKLSTINTERMSSARSFLGFY
jgi:hypothetical protein